MDAQQPYADPYSCLLPLDAPVPPQTPGPLPPGQHEISAFLRRDAQGDPIAPRHMRGYLLDIRPPSLGATERGRLAGAMASIEATHTYGPSGVFSLLAYGQSYFDRYAPCVTVPAPGRFGETDAQAVHTGAPVFLQFTSDHLAVLQAIEDALFVPYSAIFVGDLLRVVARIGGALFPGAPHSLLVEHAAQTLAQPLLPATGAQISPDQAFFMGFKSNFRAGNATEAGVTLQGGVWAGGTYAQVSHVLEDLDSWYARPLPQRAQLMFHSGRPDVTSGDQPTPDVTLGDVAATGMVGHGAKVAMARKPMPGGGRQPQVLRRDYPSVDLGFPGLQFVAFVRDLEAFNRMRTLMEGAFAARLGVPEGRNGINGVLRTLRRDTFVVPPRALRAFPRPDPDQV